jgi:hypothetical protein
MIFFSENKNIILKYSFCRPLGSTTRGGSTTPPCSPGEDRDGVGK